MVRGTFETKTPPVLRWWLGTLRLKKNSEGPGVLFPLTLDSIAPRLSNLQPGPHLHVDLIGVGSGLQGGGGGGGANIRRPHPYLDLSEILRLARP